MKIAKSIVYGALKPIAGKVGFQKFFNDLFYIALAGKNVGEGGGFKESGEKAALEYLKKNVFGEKPIIFDVGANVGGYTKDVLSVVPGALVHCFEPSKQTYEMLCNNLIDMDVKKNNCAVGEAESTMTLYSDAVGSGFASLYKRQLDYVGMELSAVETVNVITLDNYCESNSISHIDFLKMDIEGNEYNALKGASKLLDNKLISAIQIEFGGANLDSRVFFRDYWNLLHEGYYVYRICKDGLFEIHNYEETLEIFTCTNYMFITKES